MRGETVRNIDDWHGQDEAPGRRSQARGVRLSLFTWERVLGALVVLGLLPALLVESIAGSRDHDATAARSLDGHSGLVETLRFSSDGKILLTSGWDRTVRVWDVEGGSEEEFGREAACLRTTAEVYDAAISPNGETVAVAGLDGLTIWNWTDAEELPARIEGMKSCRSLAFSNDGRTLAVGGFDHRIRLLDLGTGQVEATFQGHIDVVRKIAFTADSQRLISLSFDGRIKAWDLATGREAPSFADINDVADPILTFALAPAGDVLAISRYDSASRGIELWDAAGGGRKIVFANGDRETHALAFSQDGGMLASTGSDLRIRFWNLTTGKSAGTLHGEMGWVRTLDFSADGRWVAVSSVPDQILLRRIGLPSLASHPARTPSLPETPRPSDEA